MAREHQRRVAHTAAFLRMAAIELQNIAEHEPHLAFELQHIADRLEAEGDQLRQAGGREGAGFV